MADRLGKVNTYDINAFFIANGERAVIKVSVLVDGSALTFEATMQRVGD